MLTIVILITRVWSKPELVGFSVEMFVCGDSGETMLEVGSVSHCLFSSKKLFIYCGRNSGPIILLAKSVSSEAVNSCHYVDEAL